MLKRTIQSEITKYLFKGRIIVLYGPRRVGKTTISRQILNDYSGKTRYINCEEPDVQAAFMSKTSQDMRQFLGDVDLVVMDEAQAIKDIGLKLKLLVDTYNDLQIIATGSSSFELSNSVIEPLTGRKYEFMLYPFSVNEIRAELDATEIRRRFDDMLRYGLYPDVFNSDYRDVEVLLKELTSSYMFKDIFKFQGIRNPEFLMRLLQTLALELGKEVSFTELAGTLSMDKKTVARYVELLEKAFVIFRLTPLSRNLRKELGKNRKIYFYDLGVRNSLINNYNQLELRNDVEALWENFVILERKKLMDNMQRTYSSYYWRTYDQKSIDYVEEMEGKILAKDLYWDESSKGKEQSEFMEAYEGSEFGSVGEDNVLEFVSE